MDLKFYVAFPLAAGVAYHLYRTKYADRFLDDVVEDLDGLDFLHQNRTSTPHSSPVNRNQQSFVANNPGVRDDAGLKFERKLAQREDKFHSISPCINHCTFLE
jgi:hypothetical protein